MFIIQLIVGSFQNLQHWQSNSVSVASVSNSEQLVKLAIHYLPTWCTDYYLFVKYYSPLHVSSIKCSSSGGHSCIQAAYGTVTLYKSPGGVLRHPTNNLPPTVSSLSSCVSTGHQDSYREWRYHMLLVNKYVLLKMSTWCSKHVEENSILLIK